MAVSGREKLSWRKWSQADMHGNFDHSKINRLKLYHTATLVRSCLLTSICPIFFPLFDVHTLSLSHSFWILWIKLMEEWINSQLCRLFNSHILKGKNLWRSLYIIFSVHWLVNEMMNEQIKLVSKWIYIIPVTDDSINRLYMNLSFNATGGASCAWQWCLTQSSWSQWVNVWCWASWHLGQALCCYGPTTSPSSYSTHLPGHWLTGSCST